MIPTLPAQVINEMAQRRHRLHHYLWHRVRNSWSRLAEGERRAIRDINPGWVPPRAALDAAGRPLRDNDSGEDFLFMHRRMLALVNDILSRVNSPDYPRVGGWARVPPPGDADYPVPEFPDSGLEEVKTDDYFYQTMLPLERRYTDAEYLGSVTLGQLGSDIEFTIHNDMHMRWAAPSPVGYRPSTAITQTVAAQWDSPAYDYLGDTYSSHVNPIFWKLHGWVDERVEDWKRAHGFAGEIEWRGTWVGPAGHHEHHHDAAGAVRSGGRRGTSCCSSMVSSRRQPRAASTGSSDHAHAPTNITPGGGRRPHVSRTRRGHARVHHRGGGPLQTARPRPSARHPRPPLRGQPPRPTARGA